MLLPCTKLRPMVRTFQSWAEKSLTNLSSKCFKIEHQKIINGHNGEISLPSIDFLQNQRCAIEVFKCLNGLASRKLDNHFKRLDHQKDTRGNKLNFVVPRIRTETARQAFSYQGVEIYNRLPPELKSKNSFARFKKGCNDFDFSFQEIFIL